MIKTIKSNSNKPPRIMIYGPEGVGKSTLGAYSDKPIFITPEGGADQLKTRDGSPVDLMSDIHTFDQVRQAIHALTNEDHDFKTVVLDSADWIEKLCHKKIIGNIDRSIVTCNGGYGAGYRESENLHRYLIEDLAKLRDKKNMAIVVIAHTHVREVKDPEASENYDAFEIKCHQFVSDLWREWVDALLFTRFKTYIRSSEDKKKTKAFGDDSRVMYSVKDPAFQAKNRYGMPKEMVFDFNAWDTLKSYFAPKKAEDILAEIVKLKDLVQDSETKQNIESYIETINDNAMMLNAAKNKIEIIINNQQQQQGE